MAAQARVSRKSVEVTAAAGMLRELGVRVSPREYDVLLLLAQGVTNAVIARRLRVTEGTVKQHIKNIFRVNGWTAREETFSLAQVLGVPRGQRPASIASLVRFCRDMDVEKLGDREVRRHLTYLVEGLQTLKRYDCGAV
jgi:DNA-binding CsgD family transcriptional regulator